MSNRAATDADNCPTCLEHGTHHAENAPMALRVLGTFELTSGGRPVTVGLTGQRLLTLLAIRSRQVPRVQAASTLWPDTGRAKAMANLRSALWRLQQCCRGVVDASQYDIRLSAHVEVDVQRTSGVAHRLLDKSAHIGEGELDEIMRSNLQEDIAEDIGDDEWLTAERERFRRLRVHALETLAEKLLSLGWHGAAIEAAAGAVRVDPFRECAYRLLIQAHLAEGSQLEARRQHSAYVDLLRTELGLAPSDDFLRLLGEPERADAVGTKWRGGAAIGFRQTAAF
ncbi:AfsR/SARP family transcriptional regulator [Saccharothrix stipae]